MSSIAFTSCSEDDAIVQSQEPAETSISGFLEGTSLTSFNPMFEAANVAFISTDLKNQFNLGGTITTAQIESLVNSQPEEIKNQLSNLVVDDVNNYQNFAIKNKLIDAQEVNINLTNVADLYPVKENALETLAEFFETFKASLQRQRSVLSDKGEDPSTITPADVAFSPLRFGGDGVYNVTDILNSSNKLTLFAKRGGLTFPAITIQTDALNNQGVEVVLEKAITIDDGVDYTKFFLDNIINQEVKFDDLTASTYETITGNSIEIADEVVIKTLENGEEVEVNQKAGNGIIFDSVINDIKPSNGVIHEVDKLIDTVSKNLADPFQQPL